MASLLYEKQLVNLRDSGPSLGALLVKLGRKSAINKFFSITKN